MLSNIHRRCFGQGWSAQAFEELFAGRAAWAFIAEGAAGLAVCRILSEEAEIITLGVLPNCRQSGIGSRLVEAMLEEARQQGVRKMFLEVGEHNAVAKALYDKHGFSVLSQRRHYYRHPDGSYEDAIVMQKTLD